LIELHEGAFILFSGLDFASIAFFSKGKIEIVAVQADPIPFSSLLSWPLRKLVSLMTELWKLAHNDFFGCDFLKIFSILISME
jgi:hypothetical protein